MSPNLSSNPIAHYPQLSLFHCGSATSSPPPGTSSTPSLKPHTSWTTGLPMQRSCGTTTLTQNAMKSKKRWQYSMAAFPSTMKLLTVVTTGSRQVESPTCSVTYKGGPTSPYTMVSSWGDVQEGTPMALGWESQSDKRVMSLPKHVDKLPAWSADWYCQYRCELARHMYDSLMSHLPLVIMPRFVSGAVLSPFRCP